MDLRVNYIRNLILFAAASLMLIGCGGSTGSITTTTTATNIAPAKGVTLKWVAPTTWADGTEASLSSISGYILYYGLSPTNTPSSIRINSGTTTEYTINLPSGTYYFLIRAIDSNGNPGLMSTVKQVTF